MRKATTLMQLMMALLSATGTVGDGPTIKNKSVT